MENIGELKAIQKVISGEKEFFEVLIRHYNPFLFKIGRTHGFNHEDTEDIMQETYIDVYKNMAQFHQQSSFKTWIYRIMINNCYRKNRKMSFGNEVDKEELEMGKTPMFTQEQITFQARMDNRELRNILEEALLEVPEDYRVVFSLRTIHGLSTKEVAEVLQISEANVKTRLSRAKELLRTILNHEQFITELFGYHKVHCNPFTEKM
ncbi:MAG TPA: sigma-70 family RNA polymerase sigma factor [Edaphocola sp.]|nr:sigma-70 family RNA polymerase sigma factor [Edaphocola sp.]